MWSKTYSKKVKGIDTAHLWRVWTDINQWHTWQKNIDYAKLEGDFAVGCSFWLKPKGSPKVKIELIEVINNARFTDLTRFPFAKMYGSHEFNTDGDCVEIRTTMSIEGPLSFLWKKLVAEDIVKGLPAQTEALLQRAAHG